MRAIALIVSVTNTTTVPPVPYTSLVLIHAVTMAAAMVLMMVCETLLLVARSGRRRPAWLAFRAGRVGGVMAAVGVVSGIVVLLIGGWPLRTPWLLVSLALIAAMAIVEHRFVRPWQALSAPVLARDVAGPGIRAVATDTQGLIGRMLVIALFAAVGALMVFKPDLGAS